MNSTLKFTGTLLIVFLLIFSSCKKDESPNLDFASGNEMTMTIEGKPWKATLTMLMTIPPEETEDEYYVVSLIGSEVDLDDGDDVENVKGLTIYFAVPKAKFNNPSGVYNFTDIEAVSPEFPAFALFTGWDDEYSYFSTIGSEGSIGSIKIDKFKTGKQSFMGVSVSEHEGYTHLAGSFSMTLTEYGNQEGKAPRTIQITNGKLDMSSGIGLGGLFGKYSEMNEKFLLK